MKIYKKFSKQMNMDAFPVISHLGKSLLLENYYITCTHTNGQEAGSYFVVEEYRKPSLKLSWLLIKS